MSKDLFEDIYSKDSNVENSTHGWIQWKGTNVCMDIYCTCGHFGHIDIDFFYAYECPKCHRKFAVGQNIKFIELNNEQEDYIGKYHDFKKDEKEEE